MTGLLWCFGVIGAACGVGPVLNLVDARLTRRKFDRVIRESWR
jgi:hypothetical protein